MIVVAEKVPPMSYVLSPHLDHIEWADGTRSYCRGCDALAPFDAIAEHPGYVRCRSCGREQHAANIIVNGARK